MKKYILFLLSGMLMTSCIDTEVLPNDVVIGEDFWKTKDDVTSMVAAAYKEMSQASVIERCIVWGDFRSDELEVNEIVFNDSKRTDLEEIKVGTMDYENQFSDWASLYSVINKCNIVLEKAPQVVSIDPSYTEGTLRTDESQMLALRALCYFYLVRAFRDVPVTDGAYFNSSQNFEIPQQAPLTVLDKCIEDLQKALQTPLSPDGYTDWRSVGYINRDAINAILADVYLWRASMTGNLDDYDKCVDYCDAVIESKKARYLSDNQASGPSIIGNIDHDGYPLYPGEYAYQYNFIQGNSMESIFELQLDGENISNSGLMHCYWNYDDKARTYGLMMAPASRFATAGDGNVFIKDKDYRWFESCFNVQSADATQLTVFKMVSPTGTDNTEASLKPVTAVITPGYTKIDQNWIVYRLTDVMLMKAEALVQLEASDANNLQRAFSIVNTVNKRSLAISSPTATDTLQFSSYNSKSAMEQLVLEERQRELCFEGKRWFDLMRYTYRSLRSGDANDQSALLHPDMLLSEMGGLSNMAKTSTILGNILGSDVQMSMESEPYLYFPVKQSEMKVNFLLKQNPAYEKMESIQKQ